MNMNFIKKTSGILTLTAITISSVNPTFADITVMKSLGNPTYTENIIINEDGIKVIKSDKTVQTNSETIIVNDKINHIKSIILDKLNNYRKYNTPNSSNDICNNNKDTTVIKDIVYPEYVTEVIELTNIERSKYGLSSLKLSNTLCKSAQDHADDMNTNKYFSHTSLDGKTMSDRIEKYSSNYGYQGENIAVGYGTPEQVVNGWMNSEGHRANILDKKYTCIGVGYNNGYWVQNFGG